MTLTKDKNQHLKYRKTIFFLLFATFLVTGSSFGWVKFQQEQERKIGLAQNLLAKECVEPTQADNFSATSKNVDRAVKLLYGIPKLPGSTYPAAQKELTKFSECVKDVNAKSSFLNAGNLSKKAFSVDNQTVLPLKEWQKIRLNLETAIVEVQSIPTDVDVSKQAQSELTKYQNQLKLINQKTQNEQIAVNALNRANNLKLQAENMIRYNFNLKSLSQAELKVRNAIQLLDDLPEKTTISETKKDYLETYQIVLNNIQYKMAAIRLNLLVNSFKKFARQVHNSMGYIEYSERLENLKLNFDNTFKQPFVIENETTKSLDKALSYYDDALVIKRHCYEGNCKHSTEVLIFRYRWRVLWLPASFKLNGVPITEKYVLRATPNILKRKYVKVNDALQGIFHQAEEEINQIK
jgi:hypothetical protein